jgi:hypothetical protein
MNSKLNAAAMTLLACLLPGCSSTPTINMPLEHAKLADGYVNSSSLAFGHVLVWDTESNRVHSIYRIQPAMVPSASVDTGPRFAQKEVNVSRDTKIEIGAAPNVSQAIKAEASAQFLSSTLVSLTNYNPREYRDARYVLNSPELRAWREGLAEEWSDPKYRFVFISRVTEGDKLQIGRRSAGNVGVDVDIVQIGNYKFKVSYDNKSSVTIQGTDAPITIQPTVFTFRAQGDSYRFFTDLNSPFHLQSVKRG